MNELELKRRYVVDQEEYDEICKLPKCPHCKAHSNLQSQSYVCGSIPARKSEGVVMSELCMEREVRFRMEAWIKEIRARLSTEFSPEKAEEILTSTNPSNQP